nr:hypothetical protein [uncultured Cohaesibacter sp.]
MATTKRLRVAIHCCLGTACVSIRKERPGETATALTQHSPFTKFMMLRM